MRRERVGVGKSSTGVPLGSVSSGRAPGPLTFLTTRGTGAPGGSVAKAPS